MMTNITINLFLILKIHYRINSVQYVNDEPIFIYSDILSVHGTSIIVSMFLDFQHLDILKMKMIKTSQTKFLFYEVDSRRHSV